jgi:peptide/nickel transport system permease protein
MLVVSFVIFSLLYFAPGDPAALIAGDQATSEEIERIRQSMGLDRPFAIRFLEWSWRILHGDLGVSVFSNQPVTTMLIERLEPTVSLLVFTLIVSVLVAVPIGTLAAWKAGSLQDRAAMTAAVFGFSIPLFVTGYALAYIFALKLGWLPVQGYSSLSKGFAPWIRHLILPSIALGGVYMALIARITRASVLEVLEQDYIRTARAKGVGQYSVLFVHALKNASVPIVTIIAMGVTSLIGGSIIAETVFTIPGIGRLTVDAILRRDYPVIQGVVLFFSFTYVFINLATDLLYTIIDPRIRY